MTARPARIGDEQLRDYFHGVRRRRGAEAAARPAAVAVAAATGMSERDATDVLLRVCRLLADGEQAIDVLRRLNPR